MSQVRKCWRYAVAKAGFAIEQFVEETDEESLNAIGEVDPKTKKAKMMPISFCIKARNFRSLRMQK